MAANANQARQIVCNRFQTVFISYSDHPMNPDLSRFLNATMNFEFDFDELRDQGRNNFVNNDVPTLIKDKIKTHLVANCIHTDQADVAAAEQLILNLNIRCVDTLLVQGTKTIRINDDLLAIHRRLDSQVRPRNKDVDLHIYLAIETLFLNTQAPFDFLNLAHYADNPFPVIVVNPQQQAQNPPAAPATQITTAQLMQFMAKLDQNAKTYANAQAARHGQPAITNHPCIITNFVPEAQARHTKLNTPYVHLTGDDLQPLQLPTGPAYYQIDQLHLSDSFIAVNGEYFTLRDLGPSSKKNFRNTVTKYTGTTTYEYEKWYATLLSHAKRFNKYIHPYLCFRHGVNNPKGFTVGNNNLDNVPAI